jgi:ribosomal-protein-alanine N-acetyltransferase
MYSLSTMTLDDFENIKDRFDEFDDFWSPSILESELKNNTNRYVVAKDDSGDIVGFAGIMIVYDDAEITNIVTKKSERRQGIGTLLLEELIRITKEVAEETNIEINKISLEVNENNTNAIKLYEKNNFILEGVRKNYYNNTDNALIMTKYF